MPSNKPNNKKPDEYAYVLDWLNEAVDARTSQTALVNRAIKAYQGQPSKNRYAGTIESYASQVQKTDVERAQEIRERFKDVPAKGSMVIHDAIETVVNMAMGGVGRFEFGAYDDMLNDADDELAEKLSSGAKHWWAQEKLDAVVPRYIRAAMLSGSADLHIKRNNGRTCVTIIDSSQMLKDPKRFRTNRARFIGHTQRESLREIKNYVVKSGPGYRLKTINEAEVYMSQIREQLNSVTGTSSANDVVNGELRKDLDIFYKPVQQMITKRRDTKEQDGDPSYAWNGDEVEVSYLYDLFNDMEFKIVNRRYIIDARKKKFSKNIKFKYYDSKGNEKTGTKNVSFDDPYVELPVVETYWDKYPITPLFYLLDDFDDLCAMESVLFHNLSIMAPITFIGQSSDGEVAARASQVAGEILDALPQTFGTLSKKHDIEPILLGINRIEEKIKRTLNAIDAFQAQAMVGDRATAKEVVSMAGSVSQGLNSFIANIEAAMASLGDKFLKMQVIYDDGPYKFTHNGKYSELTQQEIGGDYEVRARLASSIKLEQEANSNKAIQLIQALGGSEAVDKKEFLGTLIPIVLTGLVSVDQAKAMIAPEYRPLPDEERARIRAEEERKAKMHPVDKLDLSGITDPNELARMTAEISAMDQFGGDLDYVDPNSAPMPVEQLPVDQSIPPEQPLPFDPSMDPSLAQDPLAGTDPELAGVLANDVNGQGFSF